MFFFKDLLYHRVAGLTEIKLTDELNHYNYMEIKHFIISKIAKDTGENSGWPR